MSTKKASIAFCCTKYLKTLAWLAMDGISLWCTDAFLRMGSELYTSESDKKNAWFSIISDTPTELVVEEKMTEKKQFSA